MMDNMLSQEEAEAMLKMLKESLIENISFPDKGTSTQFNVVGNTDKDLFTIHIFRGKINATKYNLGARIKKNGIMLLELHINPSNVHINPDTEEKILGSHWHIYTQKYGRKFAFPAEDINKNDFVDTTIKFFDKFNIIKKPTVHYQEELF